MRRAPQRPGKHYGDNCKHAIAKKETLLALLKVG